MTASSSGLFITSSLATKADDQGVQAAAKDMAAAFRGSSNMPDSSGLGGCRPTGRQGAWILHGSRTASGYIRLQWRMRMAMLTCVSVSAYQTGLQTENACLVVWKRKGKISNFARILQVHDSA